MTDSSNDTNKWDLWRNRIRDICFFTIGIIGAVNQLFFTEDPNIVLFPIIGTLLGLPIAWRLDDRRKANDERE